MLYFFFNNSAVAQQDEDNISLSNMLQCRGESDHKYMVLWAERKEDGVYLHLRVKRNIHHYIDAHNKCLTNTDINNHVIDAVTYCEKELTQNPDEENIIAVWTYDRNKDLLIDRVNNTEFSCDPWPLED